MIDDPGGEAFEEEGSVFHWCGLGHSARKFGGDWRIYRSALELVEPMSLWVQKGSKRLLIVL